jgi:hypothetical protein
VGAEGSATCRCCPDQSVSPHHIYQYSPTLTTISFNFGQVSTLRSMVVADGEDDGKSGPDDAIDLGESAGDRVALDGAASPSHTTRLG